MTAPDHRPEVRRLRDENGWGSRKIGEHLGIGKDAALRLLRKLELADARTSVPAIAEIEPQTAAEFAERIGACWRKSFEGVIETGRWLARAKEALEHGEFEEMVNTRLPFTPRWAQMLMKVAADARLSNPKHASLLPSSGASLYELTKLDDATFQARIDDGTIRPEMARRDVTVVIKRQIREGRERSLAASISKQQCAVAAIADRQDWPRRGPEEALLVGRAAEHLVCADALMRGYNAFLAGQGTPYDVVLEREGKMLRVQVKGSQWERNVNSTSCKNERKAYSFSVRKIQSGRLEKQQCDIVACVALDIGAIAYLLVQECSQTVQLMSKPIELNNYVRTYEKTIFEYPLGDAVSRIERIRDVKTIFPRFPNGPYGVIYADPPWKFNVWSGQGLDRAAENHYPVMDTDTLRALGPFLPAADDCVLFLWATTPMLPSALQVMASWGFDYKSCCVWQKDKIGTGYWNRSCHELLLLGTRGDVPAPAAGTQWPSVIEAPVGQHSEKPDRFYELIEAYFPHLPKIELNARRARPGWDSWGLDAPSHDPVTGEVKTEEAAE